MTQTNTNKPIKTIDVGSFYHFYDGSPSGHPALVIWKDDKFNLYLLIKFGSTKNKNNIELIKPIGEAKKSYIYKRPYLVKRKDLGVSFGEEMVYEDKDKLIDSILIKDPIESKNIKRKDRRNYKFLVKKNPFSRAIVRP